MYGSMPRARNSASRANASRRNRSVYSRTTGDIPPPSPAGRSSTGSSAGASSAGPSANRLLLEAPSADWSQTLGSVLSMACSSSVFTRYHILVPTQVAVMACFTCFRC